MGLMLKGVLNVVKKQELKYYSLDNILKKNSVYNVIFGERSNGKTYAVLKYGIEQYFKNGGQIAIIRRWKEDITGKRASDMFSALNYNGEVKKASNGEYEGITYYAGKFYVCTYSEKGKPIYSDSDCIGYVFALSDTEHNKSISYPRITTILFDEFLTKFTYLQDEFVLFMNTISTIIRQRINVKIFMLGNTVNKYCPYFAEMGLTHIEKMEQGTIDLYTYGTSELTVAVEYCKSLKGSKENNFYFAFNNPKLNMITSGAWELNLYPHLPIKYKPKDVLFRYFIIFNDRIYQANVIDVDGEMFTYIHNKTTDIQDDDNDLIYTLEYSYKLNYNRNIYKPINTLQKKLLWFFINDKVFYQSNEVGDSISNYLKICKNL
jgi:hypothetical protein